MKNKRKAIELDRARVRPMLTTAVVLGLVLLFAPRHASAQPKPKGPPLPSFDEVMQRALREKKNTANAPAAPAPTNPPPVTVTPPTPPFVLPTPGAPTPAPQGVAKSVVPVTTAPPAQPVTPAAPTNVIHPESILPVVRVESTNAPPTPGNSSARKKGKGPVFSELPPDLRPAAVPAAASTNSHDQTVSDTTTNAMTTLDDTYRLAIGDHLSFRIVEDEEDPKPLIVTDSGELELPYLGRYPAVGKTCKELAVAVKAALEMQYYYRATVVIAVDLKTKSRGKVYLVGPVRVPGPQEIPSDEVLTLSKAILRAGGFTDFADKKNVKVTRKRSGAGDGEQTFLVNVGEILEQGRTESDLPLQPGDLIYVPERLIRF